MKKSRLMMVAFLGPALFTFLLVYLYPTIRTAVMSLFYVKNVTDSYSKWEYVGFDNYGRLLDSTLVGNIIRKKMKEINLYKDSLLFMTNIISTLTFSELDVLRLLMNGKKQKEIAQARSVELVTVKAHTSNILKKFNKERTSDVVGMIKELGLQSMIENVWQRLRHD